ncbi:EamA-like transporter family protein [Spironucleus salmonicida]|uniref:EamA-like transporter family protein n=1 Tax=Spironucleus salmonicida TaxID=348837 RepID=V6LGF5_9EUKA|nr:EamA-like transporter family protein [Spironucleus salmonicida]|eukprot:EST43378.1 Transmembrane domain-containing protein [Spironucleus salmonicida]
MVNPIVIIISMLASGTVNTVVKKIMYQTEGYNIQLETQLYTTPWWCTLIMFFGESLCLIAFYISKKESKINPTGKLSYPKFIIMITLLATCDLLQTTLTGIGLLYCPASITQILRGFLIVLVMVSARIFLKRVPSTHQLFGVCMACVGLIFVGISAVMNEGSTGGISGIILGICLTLVAQIFSSVQFVFEEKFMKNNDISSLFLVGWEGIMGSFLCLGVFLPACYFISGSDHGSYENVVNSSFMMFMNGKLFGLQFGYFISIAFFNYTAITMSKVLSSTHRALIDSLRTCFVWVVMVILYYSISSHDYGEKLTYYSILQFAGFLFMISGTLIHNDVKNLGSKLMQKLKIKSGEVKWLRVR